MSILFFILKFIGVLILIPIVLLLILLIFPICYELEGDFDGRDPKVKAKVSWAVIFLRAKIFYQDGTDFRISIFGIPMYDSRKDHWSVFGEHKKKKKKRKDSKKKTQKRKNQKKRSKAKSSNIDRKDKKDKKEITMIKEDKKKTSEDVLDLSWNEKEEDKGISEAKSLKETELSQKTTKEKEQDQKEKEFFIKKIVNFLKKCYNKCKSFFRKISTIAKKMEMIGDLFSDEDIIDAVKRIKDYGLNGVRLLLPQKLNAQITFGFEDPYYTGRVLGCAAVLIPIYGEHLDITPDFEKQILKGHIKIKGSIRRYRILLLLWKIYKDKDDLLKQKDRTLTMIGGN